MVTKKQNLLILESLKRRYPDTWLRINFAGCFDEDTINWLLQSSIDLSGHLGDLVFAAIGQRSLHLYWCFVKRDLSLKELRILCSSGYPQQEVFSMESDAVHEQILLDFLPRLVKCGISSWIEILEEAFYHRGHVQFCQILLGICLSDSSNPSREEILGVILDTCGDDGASQSLQMVLKGSEQNDWPIDWLQFDVPCGDRSTNNVLWDKGGHFDDGWEFEGDLPFLHELIKLGLPLTAAFFRACARGCHWHQTLPFIIMSKPTLVPELTNQDVLRCLSAFGRCGDETFAILELLARNGASVTDKWLTYVTSVRGEICKSIPDGRPCWRCISRKEADRCMQPMAIAVQIGNTDLVKHMIREGFEVGRRSCTARIPLHNAVFRRSLNLVQILLQAGADVNLESKTNNHLTSLHEAVFQRRLDLVQALIQAGADVKPKYHEPSYPYERSALEDACEIGHLNIVCSLLEAGADSDREAWAVATGPLAIAASHGHLDIVQLLIANSRKSAKELQRRQGALIRITSQDFWSKKPKLWPIRQLRTMRRTGFLHTLYTTRIRYVTGTKRTMKT